jgi:peptidoglycan hydrolase CwlO-like protein
MRKIILSLALLAAFAFTLPAQNNEIVQLTDKVVQLENSNAKLTSQIKANQKAISELTNQLNASNEALLKIQADIAKTRETLEVYSGNFDTRITQTEMASTQKMEYLGKSISNTTLYWIIAFLVVAFVTLFLYWQLKVRITKEKISITETVKTGNEQMKEDISGVITKNVDDLKFMFNSDVKKYNESLTEKFSISNEDLRNEFKTNLKLATEAFEEQKNKFEAQLKALQAENQKNAKSQPKADAI